MGSPEELSVRGHKQPLGSCLVPDTLLIWRFPKEEAGAVLQPCPRETGRVPCLWSHLLGFLTGSEAGAEIPHLWEPERHPGFRHCLTVLQTLPWSHIQVSGTVLLLHVLFGTPKALSEALMVSGSALFLTLCRERALLSGSYS